MTLEREKNDGESSSTIIKNNREKEIGVVAFVGNGAIEGGWKPLRTALDHWLKSDKSVLPKVTSLRCQDREAFHQLALMSYKFKIARGIYFAHWDKHKRGQTTFDSILTTQQNGLKPLVCSFIDLRKNIAQSFHTSQNGMSLRIDPVISGILGPTPHYITTNWDNTLWRDNTIENLIHLHGRCEHPDSIVFPTELIIEDTPYDFSIFKQESARLSQVFKQSVISMFRSNFIEALLSAHSLASTWVPKAKKLVIWGYSLGDYDADINALIGAYSPTDKEGLELVVINTDPTVFDRAIALTGVTNAWFYNPKTGVKFKLI